MAIPAYLWLKDDGGSDIRGSSTVQGREGSIEVVSFMHGLNLPVDGSNGSITGPRVHSAMTPSRRNSMHQPPTCTRPQPRARRSSWPN